MCDKLHQVLNATDLGATLSELKKNSAVQNELRGRRQELLAKVREYAQHPDRLLMLADRSGLDVNIIISFITRDLSPPERNSIFLSYIKTPDGGYRTK